MSAENFSAEINKIYQIAELNGYTRKIVDSLLTKHKRKREMGELTSLSLLSGGGDVDGECYTGGIFVNGLTIPFARILRKHSVILSPNSTSYKMKTLLGNSKDKLNEYDKSGIMPRFAVIAIKFILVKRAEHVNNVSANIINLIMRKNSASQLQPIICSKMVMNSRVFDC